MGSDAAIYLFNYNRYVEYIVPAIRKLILTGQAERWLNTIITHCEFDFSGINGTDLARYCSYLDADFAWNAGYNISSTWFDEWKKRACQSSICPERQKCPYHTGNNPLLTEEVNRLIEATVMAFCLIDSEKQFLGRTTTIRFYWELLSEMSVSEQDPIRELLLKLGKRAYVIGYQWSGSAEGIHGWLNPAETADLAERLNQLPLPQYPPSFEEMHKFIQPDHSSAHPDPDISFKVLSLSFVRTVAAIAAQRRTGMLWGNDVVSYPGYLPEQLDFP